MILVLSDLWVPFPGGAERLMFNLSRDLYRRGHQVVVLTSYEAAQRFDGPPVEYREIGVFHRQAEGVMVIRQALLDYAPDVILAHHLFASEFERVLANARTPWVQVVHNTSRARSAAVAVFNSEWTRRDVQMGMKKHDLVITPPAFDDVVADSHGDAIGFMKPIEHKGVDLVYAIAGAMPERRFLVLRGEWQTLEVLTDHPNVEYLDPVDDIRDFYAEVRLMIVPSVSEDAGSIGQECALNRIPCVAMRVGGLAETNAGGMLLDNRDVETWVAAIEALDDPELYERVVDSQADAFAHSRQAERLDRLDAEITRLIERPRR